MQTRSGPFAAAALAMIAAGWLATPRAARPVRAEAAGRIVPTGNSLEPRFDHTATLLPNGKVLIAGGMARNGLIEPTAELYDPHSGRFSSAGEMRSARGWGATATLLPGGKVLIAGGASGSWCSASCYLASAELYDPSANTFTLVGSMRTPRAGANAILLQNGDALIVGGNEASSSAGVASAELYHPSSGTFSATGSMHAASAAALILLKDGKVLALNDSGAELYDPSTGRFTPAGKAPVERGKFGAALLPDGRVLVAGGQVGGAWGSRIDTTEIYDPASETFQPGPEMSFTRFKLRKAVVPLGDGRILIAGGAAQPEVYDPGSNSFRPTAGSLLDCYYFSTATRLPDGEVLIVGGYARGGGAAFNHAWLYQP